MSGQVGFFSTFVKASKEPVVQETSNENTKDGSTTTTSQVNKYYNISLISCISDEIVESANTEEVKSFQDWKAIYKRILLGYLVPRVFYDPNDNLSAGVFESEDDIYFAAKFGFFAVNLLGDLKGWNQSKRNHQMVNDESQFEGSVNEESQIIQLDTQLDAPITSPGLQDNFPNDQNYASIMDRVMATIPCVEKLQENKVKSISEISLDVSTVHIQLASFLNIRKVQQCKPIDASLRSIPIPSSRCHLLSRSSIPMPHEWVMQNGPLHPLHSQVLSFEIMEEDILTGDQQKVRNLSQAVFGQKTRRIKVFLYDSFALAMMKIIERAETYMNSYGNKNPNEKLRLKDQMMIALKNVPAKCILPMHAIEARDHFMDHQFGKCAEYCICIGPESMMSCMTVNDTNSSNSSKNMLRFDHNDLIIDVMMKNENGEYDESYLPNGYCYSINKQVTQKIEKGEKKSFLRSSNQDMLDASKKLRKDYDKVQKSDKRNEISTGDQATGSRVQNISSTVSLSSNKRKAPVVEERECLRLSEIELLYERNKNGPRKKREVNIMVAVLNFGAPWQTKHDLKMNVSVFDDSLTMSRHNNAGHIENSMNCINLSVFRKSKAKFPKLIQAGDIICGSRILVDKYNGEIKLTAFDWSTIRVCRPSREALQIYQGCDEDVVIPAEDLEINPTPKSDFDFNKSQIYKLWCFAQNRMASCPNVNPQYKFTISDIEARRSRAENNESSSLLDGDLTAMVVDIIPYPESDLSLQNPKGILRLWDGTGIGRCEILPKGFVTSAQDVRSEPSMKCLQAISDIIKKMKDGHKDYIQPQEMDGFRDSHHIEGPKQLCGRVINAIIWESSLWSFFNEIQNSGMFSLGRFIRIRNAMVKNEAPLTMHLNTNTLVTPIPESTLEVKLMLKHHHHRVINNQAFNPSSAVMPIDVSPRLQEERFMIALLGDIRPKPEMENLVSCLLPTSASTNLVKFYIRDTKPAINKNGDLSWLCISKKNSTSSRFQFMLDITDGEVELSVLVPDKVAREIFQLTANEVKVDQENDDPELCRKTRQAFDCFYRLISERKQLEGAILSMVTADNEKYFILSEVPHVVN